VKRATSRSRTTMSCLYGAYFIFMLVKIAQSLRRTGPGDGAATAEREPGDATQRTAVRRR